MRPYLRERDTVTNLEFDIKGETDEEELLHAESKHDGTAEKEEQTPASAKNKFETKIFWGTKRPTYQPETASSVLTKYLVESDKGRQAEPPVDPTDAFFKSIAATVKTFSPYHQSQEYLRWYLSGIDRNITRNQVYAFIRILFWLSRWTWDTMKQRLWCKFCFSPGVRICATEIVYIVRYGYILTTVYFWIKYLMNFLLFLATVSVFL